MGKFETFAERYLRNFTYDGKKPRTIGVEKEILVTTRSGKMANISKDIWPSLKRQGLVHFADSLYTGEVAGFRMNGDMITTDAGRGTFEIILEPLPTVGMAERRMKKMLRVLLPIAEKKKRHILGLGYQPLGKSSKRYWNRKQRYEVLLDALGPKVYPSCMTASDQIHVDMGLHEFVPVFNLMNGVAGFMMALFSNSPIRNGEISKPQVYREVFWDALGRRRTGIPRKKINHPHEYLEHAWNLECLIAKKGRKYYSPQKKFSDFVKRMNADSTYNKFLVHEGAIWFDARPRAFGTIEMRPACLQPWKNMMVVPAFMLGLVNNYMEGLMFMEQFEWDFLRELRTEVAYKGYKTKIKGKPIAEFLKELVKIAEKGLSEGDRGQLRILYQRIAEQQSAADVHIKFFKKGGIPLLIKKASLKEKHLIT